MELETIRMCAIAAADPTIGVNAMLAALPLDGTDTRPDPVTIYNSVDHGWVARQVAPEDGGGVTFPALAILIAEPIAFDEVHTVTRDGHLPVGFAYVQNLSDSAKGKRDALYTNRAVLRFLTRFASNASAALRQRGGIGLINPSSTTQPPVNQQWGGGLVTALTVVTWFTRETSA